jgi:hypothetical protein
MKHPANPETMKFSRQREAEISSATALFTTTIHESELDEMSNALTLIRLTPTETSASIKG